MNTERQKIIVTGASGFLGRNLVSYFQNNSGYEVFALTSNPIGLKDKFQSGKITFCDKNIINEDEKCSFFKDSILINCAYPRDSKGSEIADGLKYTQILFQTAVDYKALGIINISSQSVYSSQRTDAAVEQTLPSLDNEYAVGKFAMELLLESICRNTETSFTNLRIASLIGPDFPVRIVNRFVKIAIETGVLNVKESGRIYGFLDIEDAVAGIASMLQVYPKKWFHTYNLGSNENYTLLVIAEEVKKVVETQTNKSVKIQIEKGEEIWNSSLDSSLFKCTFNFSPLLSLSDSIYKILYY